MASTLICTFLQTNGTKKSYSWSSVEPETPSSAVKAFVQAVLTNSEQLLDAPVASATEAKIRTTTETVYDLSV